jgi:hypothetical protein
VKRYHGEKRFDELGNFVRARIELQSLNADFRPIVLLGADEGSLGVAGEFLEVIGPARK